MANKVSKFERVIRVDFDLDNKPRKVDEFFVENLDWAKNQAKNKSKYDIISKIRYNTYKEMHQIECQKNQNLESVKFKVKLDGISYEDRLASVIDQNNNLDSRLRELDAKLSRLQQAITNLDNWSNKLPALPSPKINYTYKSSQVVNPFRLVNKKDLSDLTNKVAKVEQLLNSNIKANDYHSYSVDITVIDKTQINKVPKTAKWIYADKECPKLMSLDWIEDITDNWDSKVETTSGGFIYYTIRTAKMEYRLGKSNNLFEVFDLIRNQIVWSAYK